MAEPAIHLTPKAAQKIREQVAQRPQAGPQSGIRLGVKGGGCSGLSYVIEFCDQPRSKDRVFEEAGAKVYVDAKSLHLPAEGLQVLEPAAAQRVRLRRVLLGLTPSPRLS